MNKILLSLIFVSLSVVLSAQQDTATISAFAAQRAVSGEIKAANINIYPVPVRENNFTIESEKEFTFIKITNVIGQDIFRVKYNTPQTLSKIFLDNPQRGLYIVTILFTDETRIVRKIMIEGYN